MLAALMLAALMLADLISQPTLLANRRSRPADR
jgi:hypothetical protein